MFVFKSKYEALKAKYERALIDYKDVLNLYERSRNVNTDLLAWSGKEISALEKDLVRLRSLDQSNELVIQRLQRKNREKEQMIKYLKKELKECNTQ